MEYWILFGILFWVYSSYKYHISKFKSKDRTSDYLDFTVADSTEPKPTKPKPSYPKGGVVFEGDYSPKLMFISAEAKQNYMRTQQWRDLKARRMRIAQNRCECCGNPFTLHLHHVTYVRLTKERIEDLLILCGGPNGCHQRLHDIAAKQHPEKPYGRQYNYPLSLLKNLP